jgi:hypothetical protein
MSIPTLGKPARPFSDHRKTDPRRRVNAAMLYPFALLCALSTQHRLTHAY